jgi:hypothetical protein
MNTIYRIIQFVTHPAVIRLSGVALTLALGVVWGSRAADSIVWGD